MMMINYYIFFFEKRDMIYTRRGREGGRGRKVAISRPAK